MHIKKNIPLFCLILAITLSLCSCKNNETASNQQIEATNTNVSEDTLTNDNISNTNSSEINSSAQSLKNCTRIR